MQEFINAFDNGLAIGLIVAGVVFFYFRAWPWYTKRQADKDAEEDRRHDQYITTQKETNHLIEQFTVAINGINAAINGMGQLVSAQTNKMDDYHDQVMNELRKR